MRGEELGVGGLMTDGVQSAQRTKLSRKQRRDVLGEFELECEFGALRPSFPGSVASARRLQRLIGQSRRRPLLQVLDTAGETTESSVVSGSSLQGL